MAKIKVINNSPRVYHIGNITSIPGKIIEIEPTMAKMLPKDDFQIVTEDKSDGKDEK